MKKIYILLITCLLFSNIQGQTPDKISYQAIVRDANNKLITNKTMQMQISILQNSANGIVVYSEIQYPTTNTNGLISIEIGTGSTSDSFSTINWSNGPYYIKTETDPEGGSNYSLVSVSQITSVPFALYAKTASKFTGTLNENDPIFSNSNASEITSNHISNLNNLSGVNSGDQDISGINTNLQAIKDTAAQIRNDIPDVSGFISSESDPVYTASQAANITNTDITNLGNLSGVNSGDQDISGINTNLQAIKDTAAQIRNDIPDVSGFISSESDPVYTASQAANITNTDITNLGNLSGINSGDQDISGINTNIQAIKDTAAQIRNDIPDVSNFIISSNNLSDLDNSENARANLGLVIGTHVQAYDLDLADLSDGTLSASKLEYGSYMITSAGTSGQVWTSNGAGSGNWDGIPTQNTLRDTDGDTKIQLEKNNDEDIIRFDINGDEAFTIDEISYSNYRISTPSSLNLVLGENAGNNLTPDALFNIFIGESSGYNTTTMDFNQASYNTFIGSSSGYENTSGCNNTFIGVNSGGSNTTGSRNIAIGNSSSNKNKNGSYNICIGDATNSNAGSSLLTGNSYNVLIGFQAGYKLGDNDNGNIMIGYEAGFNETGANKLYIENSRSSNPLIYGDFNTDELTINGQLAVDNGTESAGKITLFEDSDNGENSVTIQAASAITNNLAFTLPNTDGSNGQFLSTNGSGELSWNNINTQAILADADGDTKIQVEKNSDEDIIRFDIKGKEQFTFESNSNGISRISDNGNDENLVIGYLAGDALTNDSQRNTFIGNYTGVSTISGSHPHGCFNTFLGYSSGYNNTSGKENISIGYGAGYSNTTGNYNIAIGTSSNLSNKSGSQNITIGNYANYNNGVSASYGNADNVIIGNYAGHKLGDNGNCNIMIGNWAGNNETGSYKLYIENSPSGGTTPLIYGDFNTDELTINGQLAVDNGSESAGKITLFEDGDNGENSVTIQAASAITNNVTFTLPNADGSNGQFLSTNGSGDLSWNNIETTSITRNFYIGQDTLGGIVYYIYLGQDGEQHGFIISKEECPAGQWQTSYSATNATRSWDGEYNTNLMTNSPLISWLNANFTSDWYIPSIDELIIIFNNRYHINKALNAAGATLIASKVNTYYWTSNEYEDDFQHAYFMHLEDGEIIKDNKFNSGFKARAIRTF